MKQEELQREDFKNKIDNWINNPKTLFPYHFYLISDKNKTIKTK